MFLYILSEKAGEKFLNFVYNYSIEYLEKESGWLQGFSNLADELSLSTFSPKIAKVSSCIKELSSLPCQVRRAVFIELYGYVLSYNTKGNADTFLKMDSIAKEICLSSDDSKRLAKWSQDFSDFIKVGLMYINCQ